MSDVVVDDVLEINQVKVVSPWMENAKALVLNTLSSILFDVFPDELVGCFVGCFVGLVVGCIVGLIIGCLEG